MPSVFISIKQEEIPFSEASIFNTDDNKISAIQQAIYDAISRTYSSIQPTVAIRVFSSRKWFVEISIIKTIEFPSQITIGPKLDAPQQAIEGFHRKWENSGGQITTNENHYIFTRKAETKTAQEISPKIVEEALLAVSKQWKETLDIAPLPWTRPIHSISAFIDGTPIEHKYTYNSILFEEAKSTLIPKNSMELINNEISRIEKEYSITCVSHQCVEELAWLYENPEFQIAKIPQEYLHLPKEVLVLTIAKNQRYILFEKEGQIAPEFLIVGKKHGQNILQGHIRTLRARLDDAQYYITKDIEEFCIDKSSPSLQKIIFHQKFGSVAKRVEEMQEIAREIFPNDATLLIAIMLCKNDLTSNTVQSFTELQGYCGGYFCKNLNVEDAICEAISQHYKPLNPNDAIPNSTLGRRLSFVDKLQKINALAQIGEIPTSSRDPFAIRRDILSIIRICYEERWDFNRNIIHSTLQNFVTERVSLFASKYLDDAKYFLETFHTSGRFCVKE